MSELQSFNLDIQDYAVAAGGYLELGKPADFFQIMEATGPVDVTFLHSESSVGMARGVGQGFRLGPLQNRFYGVKIYSATAQTLKLCFSSGKSPVDLSQVVSVTGTVSVVNGELVGVKNNSAFSSSGGQAAVAGQFSAAQLWNPAASGKNLVVTRISALSETGAVGISILKTTAALASLIGSGVSKKLDGAASSAEIRTAASATSLTISSATRIQTLSMPSALRVIDAPLSEPIFVPPGYGIAVQPYVAVNTHISATFQWLEELI